MTSSLLPANLVGGFFVDVFHYMVEPLIRSVQKQHFTMYRFLQETSSFYDSETINSISSKILFRVWLIVKIHNFFDSPLFFVLAFTFFCLAQS